MVNTNQRKTPLFAEVSVRNEKRPMLAEQRTVPFSFSEGAFTGNLHIFRLLVFTYKKCVILQANRKYNDYYECSRLD